MPTPGPEREVSDIEILQALNDHYAPAIAASDVSENFEMTRQGIDRRLRQLEQDGLVKSTTVGQTRIWWLSDSGRQTLFDSKN